MKLALFILAIALFILGPLLLIWSVNTLFATGIAYNIWTWLAALILGGTVASVKS